jgi:DNA-binding LacI/PurR family transcriptional regulator
LVHPPLTALRRDIPGYGTHAAQLLLAAIEGAEPRSIQDGTAGLVPRGSTAVAAKVSPRSTRRKASHSH